MNHAQIILVINPGSTSTKLAVFEGEQVVASDTLRHTAEQLASFPTIWSQWELRRKEVLDWSLRYARNPQAVVSMGGLLKPVEGGTYRVRESMLTDARNNPQGEHASNLGCALAYDMAQRFQCPAFVVDPVSVDEFEPLSRYSGHPLIRRRSLSHAPSIHANARRAAAEIGKPYGSAQFVIGHLGGGISIAAVRGGRIIDVNDASSDGPFSPERTGGLPLQPFIALCFSGNYTESQVRALVMGKGGIVAYLGTNSLLEVEQRIETGDKASEEVLQAMAYQIAKEIGAMATVLHGSIDGVVLTGGLAHSQRLVNWIGERVRHLGRLLVYPGEDEMRFLALGALRVLRGEEQAKEY